MTQRWLGMRMSHAASPEKCSGAGGCCVQVHIWVFSVPTSIVGPPLQQVPWGRACQQEAQLPLTLQLVGRGAEEACGDNRAGWELSCDGFGSYVAAVSARTRPWIPCKNKGLDAVVTSARHRRVMKAHDSEVSCLPAGSGRDSHPPGILQQ